MASGSFKYVSHMSIWTLKKVKGRLWSFFLLLFVNSVQTEPIWSGAPPLCQWLPVQTQSSTSLQCWNSPASYRNEWWGNYINKCVIVPTSFFFFSRHCYKAHTLRLLCLEPGSGAERNLWMVLRWRLAVQMHGPLQYLRLGVSLFVNCL